jgi:hypothetical protein
MHHISNHMLRLKESNSTQIKIHGCCYKGGTKYLHSNFILI